MMTDRPRVSLCRMQPSETSTVDTFHSGTIANELVLGLQELWKHRQMCDVVLKAADTTIPVHRVVVAAAIPYFRSLMSSEMAEARQGEVTLRGIDPVALECCIRFVYTCQLSLSVDTVQSIMVCANYLQMKGVIDFCCEFITRRINIDNCVDVLHFGQMIMCKSLVKTASSFLQENFLVVARSKSFNKLSLKQLVDLISLSKREVGAASEEQMFMGLSEWVQADFVGRRGHMLELLQQIRLPHINQQFLTDVVQIDDAVVSCSDCSVLVKEVASLKFTSNSSGWHMSNSSRSAQITGCSDQTDNEILVVAGDEDEGDVVSDSVTTTYSYSARGGGNRKKISSMLANRCSAGSAILHGQLYAVGGRFSYAESSDFSSNCDLATVEKYCPAIEKWRYVAPMQVKRRLFGCTTHNNKIYVCGGCTAKDNPISACEVFQVKTQTWSSISAMNAGRFRLTAVSFCGSLLALGGTENGDYAHCIISSNRVERYDQDLDEWTVQAPMHSPRQDHGASAIGDSLYIYGGRCKTERSPWMITLDSCEVLDAHTRQWSVLPAMRIPAYWFGFANGSCGKRIYCVGGRFAVQSLVKRVQIFDVESRTWSLSDFDVLPLLSPCVWVVDL